MKKKIYLHIGTNKTGSSAIQKFLYSNREILMNHDYYIPYHQHDNANYQLSDALKFGPNIGTDRDTFLKSFINEISNISMQNIIISSEYFINAKNMSQLKDIFHGFDVHIVLYLRRHDLWVESLYNQAVKTMDDIKWNTFGIEGYYNFFVKQSPIEESYKKIISIWAEAFGKEKILVRPFEKQQLYKNDVVHDFLRTVGLQNSTVYKFNSEKVNESIPMNYIYFIEKLKRTFKLGAKDLSLIYKLINNRKNNNSIKYTLLTANFREYIIEKNKKDYEWIAYQYKTNHKYFFEKLYDEEEYLIIDSEIQINSLVELIFKLIKENRQNDK